MDVPLKYQFELKFRQLIESRGMTQTFLAKQLHVSRSTINKWLTGANQISYSNLYKASQILRLSDQEVSELFNLGGYEVNQSQYAQVTEESSYDAILYKNAQIRNFKTPQEFVGRLELIQRITKQLENNKHVMLSGYPGIGKSSIAAIICNEFINMGKGPILWFDANMDDQQSLFEALLTPLNAHNKLSSTAGDATIYIVLNLLSEADLGLIIADNLNNLNLLKALRQAIPKTVPLLITSRQQASNIDHGELVTSLSLDKAKKLLAYHAQNSRYGLKVYLDAAATIQLCKRVDNHPFGIVSVGTWLHTRQDLPISLLNRLDAALVSPISIPIPDEFAESGRKTLQLLFEQTRKELSLLAQRILSQYGALAHPQATPNLLASLLNVNVLAIIDGLHELSKWVLVYESRERSFQVHDLVHIYAQNLFKEDSVDNRSFTNAIIDYVKESCKLGQFLNVLADLSNILAVASVSADEDCLAIIRSLALDGFQDRYGHNLAYLSLFDRCLKFLDKKYSQTEMTSSEKKDLHHLLSKRGNAYIDRGEFAKAAEIYQKALKFAYNIERKAVLVSLLGKALSFNGNIYSAKQKLETAWKMAYEKEDPLLMLFVLEQKSHAAGARKDFPAAIRAAKQQEKLIRMLLNQHKKNEFNETTKEDLLEYLFRALINLGTAELKHAQKPLEEIFDIHNEAMEIANTLQSEEMKAHAHFALAEDSNRQGKRKMAQIHLTSAHRLFKKQGKSKDVQETSKFAEKHQYSL